TLEEMILAEDQFAADVARGQDQARSDDQGEAEPGEAAGGRLRLDREERGGDGDDGGGDAEPLVEVDQFSFGPLGVGEHEAEEGGGNGGRGGQPGQGRGAGRGLLLLAEDLEDLEEGGDGQQGDGEVDDARVQRAEETLEG